MLKTFTALAIALSASALALAATDGTLGNSSSGTAEITLNVSDAPAAQIKVSGLDDIRITHTREQGPGGNSAFDWFCVYMDSAGTYKVEIKADSLADGLTIFPYRFIFRDFTNQNPLIGDVTSDQSVSVSGGGFLQSGVPGCTTGLTARLSILTDDSQLQTPIAAVSTTITITVSPE